MEDTLIGACLRSGFRPAVRYVVQEWTAKQGLVAAGLGITLVPGLAASAVRPDIVVKRLRAEEMTPRAVYAATSGRARATSGRARATSGRSPAVSALFGHLLDSAAVLRRELADLTR